MLPLSRAELSSADVSSMCPDKKVSALQESLIISSINQLCPKWHWLSVRFFSTAIICIYLLCSEEQVLNVSLDTKCFQENILVEKDTCQSMYLIFIPLSGWNPAEDYLLTASKS